VFFMSPQDPREEVAAALTPLLQDAVNDPSTAIRAMGTWGSEKKRRLLVELLDPRTGAGGRWAAIDAWAKS